MADISKLPSEEKDRLLIFYKNQVDSLTDELNNKIQEYKILDGFFVDINKQLDELREKNNQSADRYSKLSDKYLELSEKYAVLMEKING